MRRLVNDDRGPLRHFTFPGQADADVKKIFAASAAACRDAAACSDAAACAAIGFSNPPQIEKFFTEATNPDEVACIYSHSDAKYPKTWAWGTKYVGDKPADSTISIEKEKQRPAPVPQPQPTPPRRDSPTPRPDPPARREKDYYPYIILGSGFGFIIGFVMGIVLYEPFGSTRGRPNPWN